MNNKRPINRRQFVQNCTSLLGAGSLAGADATAMLSSPSPSRNYPQDTLHERQGIQMQGRLEGAKAVWIFAEPGTSSLEQLAAAELARGLRNLGLAREPRLATQQGVQPAQGELAFALAVRKEGFNHAEAYEIRPVISGKEVVRVELTGASPPAVLHSVFDFLERQGAFFGLDGEVYPLEEQNSLTLPPPGEAWRRQPSFGSRGLLPFPDFLNCISVYNREEYRAALEAMARMRFNTLFTFCHTSGNETRRKWNNESFLSFEYGGIGHWCGLQTTATFGQRWGYLPQRTSQYGMGAADFFAGEVFGSEAATQAQNIWEEQEFAQKLLAEAFQYAHRLGIRVVLGFEVYSIPDEIVRAAPPEALWANNNPQSPLHPLDPASAAAQDILERRLAHLLEAYPDVDYVSLWQDEATNFATRRLQMPFSLLPFQQAYDFLRRHSPKVRMVVSGWGGVTRNFAEMHRQLPEEVIFSALTDSLGWDPVSEEYGKLGSRERWPIPWLEDDGSMWFPQFLVHRWQRDMDLARQYGCQGIMGIHWRTRIIDPNAGFLSRYCWQPELKPDAYYLSFSEALVRAPRAQKLAALLTETDRDQRIVDSLSDENTGSGHATLRAFSGDYSEGFNYWAGFEASEKVKVSQRNVASELRALAEATSSPAENERLNYFAQQAEFLVPYTASWDSALQLYQVLQKAGELKQGGKGEQAQALVKEEGSPIWLQIAPEVRRAILNFQRVVGTRNDLGALASLHNKYERVALFRLMASIKEYLRELPESLQKTATEARRPDSDSPPRVFIPTRPSVLTKGTQVRICAVALGGQRVEAATLFTRISNDGIWTPKEMKLLGRRTYVADLSVPQSGGLFLDYFVRARLATSSGALEVTAPLEASRRFYTVTVPA